MTFGSLPVRARWFLVFVCLAGLASMALALALPLPRSDAKPWELLVFIGFAAVAGGQKVSLLKRLKNEEAGSMSLGFAVTFVALLRFGPSAAILIAAIASLSGCMFPKRQPAVQIFFNVALSAVEAMLGGLLFMWTNGGSLQLHPVETFIAVTATVLTFYSVNTFGVATIIAICTEERPYKVWRESFLWTAPSYFATASISALAILVFQSSVIGLALFIVPVAYLVYQSYDTYTSKAEEHEKHIAELQLSQHQLADLYLATIKSLALAIDAKDKYTHQHILRVQRYAVAIAKQMGLTGPDLEAVNTGALLHDIGKLGVPEYLLMKPGRLTPEEFDKIKKHPEIGEAILDPVEFPWPVLPVVRHHHEKWDGTGYPDGLKGEDIPLAARIMAVADVYDALTSSRSYRTAWTHEAAVAAITKDSGTHFDPEIVKPFLEVIDSVVQEMAEVGEGPLVPRVEAEPVSKAAQGAKAISHASIELWALYEVAQTLSSSLGTQDTVEILLKKLLTIFPDTACVLLLRDGDQERVVARSAAGVNTDFFMGCYSLESKSRSVLTMIGGESYLGAFEPDDLVPTASESSTWNELGSALIVPIICQGEPLGTLNIYHTEAEAFTEHDKVLLELIAERSAMALRNGQIYDRTRSEAVTDPLTGAYNVRYLTEHVEKKCFEGAPPFSLLCLDVDAFQPINDNFGHHKGDEVLCDLARIFIRAAGPGAVIARYGGDEFVIVLNASTRQEAEAVVTTIHQSVEAYDPKLHHYKLGSLRLGVSIGIACYPEDGADCAALVAAADENLVAQKGERKLQALAVDPGQLRKRTASEVKGER